MGLRVAIASALLVMGCAPRPAAPVQTPRARCTFASPPSGGPGTAGAPYRYAVTAAPRSEELCVEVAVPPGPVRAWSTVGRALPYVRDVTFAREAAFEPVVIGEGSWLVPACEAARGCRLRYRVLLAEAATALDDYDYAEHHRGALLSPPSSWLLRPAGRPIPCTCSREG